MARKKDNKKPVVEIDKWKLVAFLLMVIIMVQVYFYLQSLKPSEEDNYNFNGFQISKENMERIEKVTEGSSIIQLCNIELKKCIYLQKLPEVE